MISIFVEKGKTRTTIVHRSEAEMLKLKQFENFRFSFCPPRYKIDLGAERFFKKKNYHIYSKT